MNTHYNIRVHGQVQGVTFRYSALAHARRWRVTGFVRNDPDGTVYLEVEGSPAALEKFLRWCKKGPWFAKVERLEVAAGGVVGFLDFTIHWSGV